MEPLEPRDPRRHGGPYDTPVGRPEDPGGPGKPLANPGDLRDPDPAPDEELYRRDELADRAGAGSPSPAGRDRPDLLTGVEPPELPM